MKRIITLSVLFIALFNLSAFAWIKFTDEELAMEAPDWCIDADILVLDYIVNYEMTRNTDGLAMNIYTTLRYKVLTEEGIDQSDFTLPIGGSEKLLSLKARTITPEGKKKKVKKSNIFEKVIYVGRKKDKKRKVKQIAFPEVSKGAILEVKYSLYSKNIYFMEPHYYDFENHPTLYSKLHFKISMGAEYFTLNVNTQYYDFKEENGTLKTPMGPMPYYWCEIKNIKPMHNLPFAPAEDYLRPHTHFLFTRYRNQYVNIPIIPDWKAACEMYNGWVDNFLENDEGVDSILEKFEDVAGMEAKARALFSWVSDSIEYVDSRNCFEFGGDVEKIVSKRKGRGMEKTLLLKHLLEKSGMRLDILLGTPMNDGPTLKNIPAIAQFRGYLLRLKIGNETFFLDPTFEQAEFGGYPWYWCRGNMLLVNNDKPEFIKIPEKIEKANELWDFEAYLRENGDIHVDAKLTINSYYYKNRLLRLRDLEEEDQKDYFLRSFLRNVKEEDVDSLNIYIQEDNVFENSLRISFTLKEYAELFDNQYILGPNLVFKSSYDLMTEDMNREVDIQFSHPRTVTYKMKLHLPEGCVCTDAPINDKQRNKSMGYFISCFPSDEGKIVNYQRTYSRKHWFFNKESYNEIRNFFNSLATVDNKEIVIQAGVQEETMDN